MSRIDIEQRFIVPGSALKVSRDGVVALHNQPDQLLHLFGIFEDGRRVLVHAGPYHWQPFAGHDQIRTDKDAGEKAIELGEQHRLVTVQSSEQLLKQP